MGAREKGNRESKELSSSPGGWGQHVKIVKMVLGVAWRTKRGIQVAPNSRTGVCYEAVKVT